MQFADSALKSNLLAEIGIALLGLLAAQYEMRYEFPRT
jgi:hypothetical protein